ncbi:MAG: L,D-transpeptidase family protein [Chloroflexota bacterium]
MADRNARSGLPAPYPEMHHPPAPPAVYRRAARPAPPQYHDQPEQVIRIPLRRTAGRQSARRDASGGAPALSSALLLGLLGLSGLLALALGSLALVYAYYQASDRILPGVQVGGVPLGGLKRAEAAEVLQAGWQWESRIAVSNGIQTAGAVPAELGLRIDAGQTAARAHAVGHSGSMLLEWTQLVSALSGTWPVSPVVTLDEETARRGLEKLVPELSMPAKDAGLSIQGTQISAVPGQLGYTIDLQAALRRLAEDPAGVAAAGRLDLQPQPVIPAVNDVTQAIADAQRLLAAPLTIQAYDPVRDERLSWPVPPETIAAWLTVVPGAAGPQAALDQARVAGYLQGLGDSLGDGRFIDGERNAAPLAEALRAGRPYPAIISHPATSYTVQPGDTLLKIGWKLGIPYWMISQANPDLDPDALSAGQQLTIPSKDRLLPLPVVPNKRIVISITHQRMWIYQDGQQINEHVISTGIDRSPTQPGVFQVQTHDKNAYASVWDLYMPDFLGIYEAWPGFMNGIHGLPTLSNGQRLWANVLGQPASYGCIILDLKAARQLYDWAENGVVVEIKP